MHEESTAAHHYRFKRRRLFVSESPGSESAQATCPSTQLFAHDRLIEPTIQLFALPTNKYL